MNQPSTVAPRPPAPEPTGEQSLAPLLRELAQDSSALIKQEIALAKAELRQSVSVMAGGAIRIGIALALLATGGLVLIAFIVLLLGSLLANYWLSALIVGLVFTTIGGLLALSGVGRMKEVQMAPETTLQTLKDDGEWAKEEVQQLKRGLKS